MPVRTVAMDTLMLWQRGVPAFATGSPIQVPVARITVALSTFSVFLVSVLTSCRYSRRSIHGDGAGF